jgi:hypothetical protein
MRVPLPATTQGRETPVIQPRPSWLGNSARAPRLAPKPIVAYHFIVARVEVLGTLRVCNARGSARGASR